jgi:tetratricopeptide (TPR) repeat protein
MIRARPLLPALVLLALGASASAQDAAETPSGQAVVTTYVGGAPIHGKLVTAPKGQLWLESAEGWQVKLALTDVVTVRTAERWWIPAADQAEDLSLAAEGRGDSMGAFKACQAQVKAILNAHKSGAISADEAGAEGEVALARLEVFASETGRSADVIELLARVSLGEWLTPLARDLAGTYLVWHLRKQGLFAQARNQERSLGTVSDFYLMGPFDNERGRGMALPYLPEKQAFDPQATAEGKGLQVGWRPTPTREDHGTVELDELFQPNDQCLAYAVTYLHAKRRTRVALRIGSDEALKVWVNRVSVLERAIRREFAPDQDHVGVVLEAGWNEVLLKVGDQTGDWRFRLRVTAPAGGPASGVRAGTLAEIAGKPSFSSGTAERCEVATGGLVHLEARAKQYPRDHRARFHLGYSHFVRGAHDQTRHPDREAFLQAAQLKPGYGPYQVYLAYTQAGDGEFSVNAEHNARRRTLEAAGDHPEARLLLAEYYLDALDNVEKGAAILAPVVKKYPTYLAAQIRWLEILRRRGHAPLARAALKALCYEADESVSNEVTEHWPPALLEEGLSEARQRGDARRETEILDQLLLIDRTDVRALLRLGVLHARTGRDFLQLQFLRQALKLSPTRADLWQRLAGYYSSRRQLGKAVEALEGALKIKPQGPALIEALGRLQERLGKGEQARALFEQALRLDPKRVRLKKYLTYLDRNLAAKLTRFEDPWILDAKKLLAAAKRHPLDKKRTHRVVLRQEVDHVNPDGTKSQWRQEVLRVENEDGAKRLRVYRAGYESGQRIEVQLARVYRASGAQVDVRVGSAGGGGSYGVRFPALEPGDAIEIRYRTDDLRQGFFGDYYGRQVFFQDFVPVDLIRFVLLAPATRKLYFHSPAGRVGEPSKHTTTKDTNLWVWERRDVAALEPEPNMPWLKEALPQLQVSTFKDWNSFSRWYWGLVKAQHEADGSIKRKVAELTAGAKTREEKIQRIYDFVVTKVRYNDAWEFGVHGFKPYNATKIFARRFGDCKDKATLIGTMLSVLDIKAHPVLIFGKDGRGREDLSLPLMRHFNHCISWVDFKGGIFLDGTAEYHPYGTLPSMDYGAKVVVITPDKALIKEIPFRGPMHNGMREKHRVVLDKDGKGHVSGTLLGTGTYDVILREWMTTKGSRKEVLEPRLGRTYNGAKVEKVEAGDPIDLSKPFPVKVQAVIPRMLRPATGGGLELVELRSWLFDLVYLRGGKLSNLAADSQRTQDVVLPVPSGVDESVRYVLPAGYRLRSVPAPVKIETPFGRYMRTFVRQPDGGISVRRVLQLKTNRIPHKDYKAFRKFVEQIDRAEGERPIVERGGGEQ